jgi:integrase
MSRWGTLTRARLTDQSVALIVKRRVVAIGQDPKLFAGHSLHASLATSAAADGATERGIMQQTGHRSVAMVRRYIREGEMFTRAVRLASLDSKCQRITIKIWRHATLAQPQPPAHEVPVKETVPSPPSPVVVAGG